ncbi:hypothetical protein P7C70_g5448, partial [Phenoliferia sp. Uapishka_3]
MFGGSLFGKSKKPKSNSTRPSKPRKSSARDVPPGASITLPTFGPPAPPLTGRALAQHLAVTESLAHARLSLFGPAVAEALGGHDEFIWPEEGVSSGWAGSVPAQAPSLGAEKYSAGLKLIASDWDEQRPTLFPVFSKLRHDTNNFFSWTTTTDLDLCQKPETCVVRTRTIKLFYITHQSAHDFAFCSCHSDVVQLAAHGFLACTPRAPASAFSFLLLAQQHTAWLEHPTSIESWSKGMMAFHGGMMGTFKVKDSRVKEIELRHLARAAVDEYRNLLQFGKKEVSLLLGETQLDIMAARCPACFGSPDTEELLEATRCGLHQIDICLDGNFQQSRDLSATNDAQRKAPELFLGQEVVDAMEEEVGLKQKMKKDNKDDMDFCNDSWKAAGDGAKTDGSSFDRKSDTGLLAAVCRHEICVKLVNITKSGEKCVVSLTSQHSDVTYPHASSRLFFALALISFFMTIVAPLATFNVEYDIACNLYAHMLLRNILVHLHSRLRLATSVFHAFAHIWPCQIKFNPRLIFGFGFSDGEACERLWNRLRGLIPLNRGATSSHRLENLALRTEHLNLEHRNSLPAWLSRRLKSAQTKLDKANAELTQLSEIHPTRFSSLNLLAEWEKQREAQRHRPAAELRSDAFSRRSHFGALFHELDETTRGLATIETRFSTGARNLDDDARVYGVLRDRQVALKTQLAKALADLGAGPEFEYVCRVSEGLTSLRLKVLGLRAMYQPLKDARAGGRGALMGYAGIQYLLRKFSGPHKAATKAIKTYNDAVALFLSKCPNPIVVPPTAGTLKVLLALEPSDPFWHDDYFLAPKEAWATDADVKAGIAWVLQRGRAEEEIIRIGWEVRRMFAWVQACAVKGWETRRQWRETGESLKNDQVADLPLPSSVRLRCTSDEVTVACVMDILHQHASIFDDLCISWYHSALEDVYNRTGGRRQREADHPGLVWIRQQGMRAAGTDVRLDPVETMGSSGSGGEEVASEDEEAVLEGAHETEEAGDALGEVLDGLDDLNLEAEAE